MRNLRLERSINGDTSMPDSMHRNSSVHLPTAKNAISDDSNADAVRPTSGSCAGGDDVSMHRVRIPRTFGQQSRMTTYVKTFCEGIKRNNNLSIKLSIRTSPLYPRSLQDATTWKAYTILLTGVMHSKTKQWNENYTNGSGRVQLSCLNHLAQLPWEHQVWNTRWKLDARLQKTCALLRRERCRNTVHWCMKTMTVLCICKWKHQSG